jgi:hypothetical protein
MTGICEHGNEHLGSIKGKLFLSAEDCQFFEGKSSMYLVVLFVS